MGYLTQIWIQTSMIQHAVFFFKMVTLGLIKGSNLQYRLGKMLIYKVKITLLIEYHKLALPINLIYASLIYVTITHQS